MPPSCIQPGSRLSILVLPAGYGYTSPVTSTPRARASAMMRSAASIFPQFSRPEALTWAICTGTPPSSAMRMASTYAGSSVAASPRTWEK